MAAVLAGGAGAVLSHRPAGALWQICSQRGVCEVTVPGHVRSRAGLRVHQAQLPPDEITTHDGIPVTTPERTQFDLAAVLPPYQLQRALSEAEVQRLPGAHSLLDRYPSKRGRAHLKRPPAHTKSDLEARFLAFLNDRRFPTPLTNALVEGHEVDAVWPGRKLIVELDSWTFHGTRHAFERDRRRDRHLTALGWTVIRITWRDLDEPDRLERELRALGL